MQRPRPPFQPRTVSLLPCPQVPTWREDLISGRDWAALAAAQSSSTFSESDAARNSMMAQATAMSAMLDAMAALNGSADGRGPSAGSGVGGGGSAATSAAAAVPAKAEAPGALTLKVFRQAGGKWAELAALQVSVDAAVPPEHVQARRSPRDKFGIPAVICSLRPTNLRRSRGRMASPFPACVGSCALFLPTTSRTAL